MNTCEPEVRDEKLDKCEKTELAEHTMTSENGTYRTYVKAIHTMTFCQHEFTGEPNRKHRWRSAVL